MLTNVLYVINLFIIDLKDVIVVTKDNAQLANMNVGPLKDNMFKNINVKNVIKYIKHTIKYVNYVIYPIVENVNIIVMI